RAGQGYEFELLDTGVFDEDRYFDIFIEYAKFNPEDWAIRVEAWNRGPAPAPLHVLPHLWFRNIWAWGAERAPEPDIQPGPAGPGFLSIVADDTNLQPPLSIPPDYRLGRRTLYGPAGGSALFTFNESNDPRVFGPGHFAPKYYVKDAFHRYLIDGEPAINPDP